MTCLFIAAKIEEIYPPKLSDFAYVTDGACKEEEILTMELIVLKELNWGLSPMTPNAWVKLYLQVSTSSAEEEEDESDDTGFVTPRFSGVPYVRVMQLLDLAVLDTTSLAFRYSILAAAAVAVMHGPDVAVAASGHRWEGELQQCVSWLLPFAAALAEDRHRPTDKPLPNVGASNLHNILSHSVDLAALDRAQELVRVAGASSPDLSANPAVPPGGVVDMTPPEAEGDVYMKEDKSKKKGNQLSSPTVSSTSASNAVFFSPETPTSSHRHQQQSRSVMNAR